MLLRPVLRLVRFGPMLLRPVLRLVRFGLTLLRPVLRLVRFGLTLLRPDRTCTRRLQRLRRGQPGRPPTASARCLLPLMVAVPPARLGPARRPRR